MRARNVHWGAVVVMTIAGLGLWSRSARADDGCPPTTKGLDVTTVALGRLAVEHANFYRQWQSSGEKPPEPTISRGRFQSIAENAVHQLETELFPYGLAHRVMLEVIDLDYLTTLKANPPVCTRSDAQTCAAKYDAVASAWHGLQPLIDMARDRLRAACLNRKGGGSGNEPNGATAAADDADSAPQPWRPGQPLTAQPGAGSNTTPNAGASRPAGVSGAATGGGVWRPGATNPPEKSPIGETPHASTSSYGQRNTQQIEADRRRNEEIVRINREARERNKASVDAFAQDLGKRAAQDKTVAPVFMGASMAVLLGAMVVGAVSGNESAQAGVGALAGIFSAGAGFGLTGALVEARGLPTEGNVFVAGATATSFSLSLGLGLGYAHSSAGQDLGLNEFNGESIVHLSWVRLSMRSGYRFGGGHKAAPTMFGAALQPLHGGLISPYLGVQGGMYPQSGVELMNGTTDAPDSSRGVQWVLGNTWSFDRVFRRAAGPMGHRSLYVDTAWLLGGGAVYGSGFQLSIGTRFTFGTTRRVAN